MDKHRLGLRPVLRRAWAPRGERPLAPVQPRELYLYGLVEPQSGRTEWLLMPTVSIAAFAAALRVFAEHTGASADKRVLRVVDRAGWHLSPRLVVPEGVERVPLPPHSPELQPAERLWPLTNAALANRTFTDLEQVQATRCRVLQDRPELVRAYVRYHW